MITHTHTHTHTHSEVPYLQIKFQDLDHRLDKKDSCQNTVFRYIFQFYQFYYIIVNLKRRTYNHKRSFSYITTVLRIIHLYYKVNTEEHYFGDLQGTVLLLNLNK